MSLQSAADIAHASLDQTSAPADPYALVTEWYEEARRLPLLEPGAIALATTTADGHPSVRMVLLKEFSPAGFVFYTNYRSRKGSELTTNPHAAILLYWDALERQIRVEGKVEILDSASSDLYFNSRPIGSRISASISEQSQPVSAREILVERVRTMERELGGQDPVRPAHWGGYRLKPSVIEFWQGRRDRLHDRLVYSAVAGNWKVTRLQP